MTFDGVPVGEKFQRGMEKFQSVKRAGPVADQPSRLRTPPGVGGEGWPVSLLCSRNARPRKGLVGRAQLETNRPTLYMETRASLVGALKAIGCQVSATRCGNYLDQLNG